MAGGAALVLAALALLGLLASGPIRTDRKVDFEAPQGDASLLAVFFGLARCGSACPPAVAAELQALVGRFEVEAGPPSAGDR